MRRRKFITLLGGATAWPLTALAQQSTTLPVVGVLVSAPASSLLRSAAIAGSRLLLTISPPELNCDLPLRVAGLLQPTSEHRYAPLVAWPIKVSGQQIAMPVIGFLGSATSQGYATVIRQIWEGLNQEGYTERRNAIAEYRWADGQSDRLPDLAADLVRRRVAVIVTTGGPVPTRAALDATSTIPIVFVTGSDPVEGGLVRKMSGSGANVTGVTFFSNELAPKRLEVMSEVLPSARVFAMLMNSRNPNLDRDTKQIQAAAAAKGVTMFIVYAAGEGTPATAFEELAKKRVHAVLVHNDSVLYSSVRQIIALAAQYSIPTMYFVDECPKLGGLISYGTNNNDAMRQAGVYVGRILKGEKTGELPIQAPTKFELVINLKAAKTLGLTIPSSVLTRADEVIE